VGFEIALIALFASVPPIATDPSSTTPPEPTAVTATEVREGWVGYGGGSTTENQVEAALETTPRTESSTPEAAVDVAMGTDHDEDLAETIGIVLDQSQRSYHAFKTFKEQRVLFVTDSSWTAQTGDGKTLKGAKLYEYVGRPDLAARYDRGRKIRGSMLIAGGLLAATGASLAFYAYPPFPGEPSALSHCLSPTLGASQDMVRQSEQCVAAAKQREEEVEDRAQRLGIGGAVAWAVGTVLVIVGATAFGRPPVSRTELRQIVRSYNRTLFRKLGLDLNVDVRIRMDASLNGGRAVIAGHF